MLKFDTKGDKIEKLPNDNLVAEYQKSGSVKIGVKAQKGLTSSITGLKTNKFTVLYPREAKACASWFDAVLDPQDLLEDFKMKKLTVIRNYHAILKSVKRAHSIVYRW